MVVTGCAGKAEEQKPSPVRAQEVVPVEVPVLDAQPFSKSFDIAINQAVGGADYLVTQAIESSIEVTESKVQVTGCAQANVKVEQVWFEEASQTLGIKVAVGQRFLARAGVKGRLQIQFAGLTGCTRLAHTLTLTKKTAY